ncbi:hypothetical protein HYW84_04495, partial [Candidatus Peregrinibacteria bacterium]|nr:hypothetical protein [Candidatus Peregrinibacteria bacterium]
MKKGKRIGIILTLAGGIVGSGVLFATVSGFRATGSSARVDWQQTAGPIGGVVNRMKTINGEVWASLYSGGIYKFAD